MVSTTTVSNVWPTFALEDSSGLDVRTMMTLPSGSTSRCAGSCDTAKNVKGRVHIPRARDFVLVDVIVEGPPERRMTSSGAFTLGQHGSFRLVVETRRCRWTTR